MSRVIRAIPRRLNLPRGKRGLIATLVAAVLLLGATPMAAQIIPGTAGADSAQEPAKQPPAWSPPDVAALSADFWSRAGFADVATRSERLNEFVESIRARVEGLDGQPRADAIAAIANLASLVELLEVTRQGPPDEQFEPVPTQESYTLQDVFRIRRLSRGLDGQETRIELELEQLRRQLRLLQERRERLVRTYQGQSAESPARIVTGIELVTARIELELTNSRIDNLSKRQNEIHQRLRLVSEQEQFALSNLAPGDRTIDEEASNVSAARTAVAEAGERITAVQSQLFEALSSDPANESLVVLRRQQLTRANALQALTMLRLQLAEAGANWHRLREDALDPEFDLSAAASDSRERTIQARQQVGVLSAATEATLTSVPSDDTPNARANHDLAQAAARETLALIEEIQIVSDDLLLMQEVLAEEIVASQSGLRKAWSSLRLSFGSFYDRLERLADSELFSIGETSVTPAGIFMMLLILAFAWGISWVTRYLIRHAATGGDQFSQSPVAYTLGRILHYVIMTVGVFAAFTSIGFDFTSFALIAGALSVGIGFGLQAIVNNFVSGLILLLEGSLRVGDYIELDQSLAGMVKEINTRATVVNTNDNVDVVVPNSELVTTRLTNWTLRESIARMRIPFGVAYGSDKEKVREAAMAAAEDVEFVLTNMPGRRPQLRLYNFGDSALEFDMLLWVSRAGVRRPHRIRCEFLWHLETRLAEAGIEIPFPQRDLHLRSDFRHPPTAEPPRPTGLQAEDGDAQGEAGETAEPA